ncbi:hypothetical protein [Glutamicibacter sp.]|uniref:hypothetical protein n=1 Tax=Glutamicibacter sp. TaxID=1931995 RepID=UPI0028BE0380|nr:hypothetical protein [Glutamicibacter sp.]
MSEKDVVVVNRLTQETAERTVNAFGVRVLVRIKAPHGAATGSTAAMIERLTTAWSDSPQPRCQPTELPVVDLGEVHDENFERIHSIMSTEVTLAALEFNAGRLLMFHAGGIARHDGKVALITGPSGRGKTTTLRHLGLHYGYVSDETIAIDFGGTVHPYRKPLSVITEGHRHKLQISPSELNLRPLPNVPLKVGGIAVLERAGRSDKKSTVTQLGFAAGIVAVVEQSSYMISLERPLTQVAELAASIGGFKILTVGKPETIHLVAEELFVPGTDTNWTRAMPSDNASSFHDAAYLVADVIDAVACDDGTVVFTQSLKVVLLDGIGPELWSAACKGERWEELVDRIESVHGPAPSLDTRGAVKEVAEELVCAGILRPGKERTVGVPG